MSCTDHCRDLRARLAAAEARLAAMEAERDAADARADDERREWSEVDAENERMGRALADARRRLAAVEALCDRAADYGLEYVNSARVRAALRGEVNDGSA